MPSLILPITTRGIGINLCSFYADVIKLIPTKIELPEIYASYRALLGLVESRLLNINRGFGHTYSYSPHLRSHYRIMDIPIIFKRLLEAIDVLEYRSVGRLSITYCPAMSKDTVIDGNFIPRPENLVLSNLRKTVKALEAADVDDDEHPMLLQHRQNFYKNNPIPGAKWNNYRLTNADEIISPDYDIENDVYDDMNSLLSLSMLLTHYSNYFNKESTNRKESRANFSSFVCNEMGDLRVPDRGSEETLRDYYRHSRPKNNIDSFYSRFRLRKEHIIRDGALFLLGEYPNDISVANPIYELRSEHVNSYFYAGYSYSSSYLSYHSNIIAKSLKNA